MAVTTGVGISVASADLHQVVYELLTLMRTGSSWTLYGGGDGVGPGQGPGYYWTAASSASSATSWMCMKAPNSDLQLLFTRYDANGYNWTVYADPEGAYTGGDYTTLPTSASAVAISAGSMAVSGSSTRMHALVDTGTTLATCGFAVGQHAQGSFTTARHSFAFVPMTTHPTAEVYPWAFYRSANGVLFSTESLSNTTGDTAGSTGCRTLNYRDGSLHQTYPFTYHVSSNGWADEYVFPGAVLQMGGSDIVVPTMWGVPLSTSGANRGFKGMSDFMRWNGYARANFDTLNSLAYIHMGTVVLPWDGSSTPGTG
jgi:hypothetical protein